MASCSAKAAASLFKRTLVLSPPRGGGGRCGGGSGSSLGTGRARSGGGSRLLQPLPAFRARSLTGPPTPPPVLFLQDSLSDGLRVCYKYLNETSRSFAVVIQALDEELR